MRCKSFSVFLLTVIFAISALFIGCEQNPTKPPEPSDHPNLNGKPLAIVADSVVNGKIMLLFYLDAGLFNPAETRTALRGFDDWNVGYSGKRYDKEWFYYLEAAPGVYKFNFWGSKGWADSSKMKNSEWFFPELGDCGIKITSDFQIEKPSLGEMLRIGQSTPIIDTGHQIVIIRIERVRDTIYDTIPVSQYRGTVVFLGDSVVFRRNPSVPSAGWDTVRISDQSNPNPVINYDAIVRMVSYNATVNGSGASGFKIGLTFDPVLVRTPIIKPFIVGLPSWTMASYLDPKNADNRYPYTVSFIVPGRYNFGVGGDYATGSSWADSNVLKKSIWGVKTSSGWLFQGVVMKDGRFLPGSLVDTIQVPPIHDTIYVRDTVVRHDTITIPGRVIIDTVIVIRPGDTVHVRDTVMAAGDLVKTDQSMLVSAGVYNFHLSFFQGLIRTVTNGQPFNIGLPDWNAARSLGALANRYYPYTVTLAVGTYTFGVGGDSARSWVDSTVLKNTVWGFKTTKGWVMRGTVTKDGRFIPTSQVGPNDTVVIHDTVRVRDTVIHRDTIPGPHDTTIIRDTMTIIHIQVDTLVRIDTLHQRDTFHIVDQGTVTVPQNSLQSDTAWLDTITKLKGIAQLDSIYRLLYIHTVMSIGPKHDTTYARDTTRKITDVPLAKDTFDLVLLFGSATQVSGDTFTVNFRLNAKVFAYLGANETVANAFGLLSNWSDKTPSVSLSGGYFNFSAKMVRGQKYRLNFQGDKGTWAEQRTLKLSAYAYSSGTSTDLSLSLNTAVNGFVFVMPATKK